MRALCLTLLLVLGLLWVVFAALAGVNGNGFDETVVYHLGTGLGGAGIAGYERHVAKWSLVALVGAGLLVVLFRYFIRIPREGRHQYWASAFLVGALATNPIVPQVAHQLPLLKVLLYQPHAEGADTSLGELAQYYREIPAEGLGGLDKNIVLLYLESLETTYFDETHFGQLLPELSALADDAVRFADVEMGPYTWWTMGGIVGSQCGVPLVPFGAADGNGHLGFGNFMGGATCIGDILQAEGYQSEFVGGASLRFAGKADYLRSHGYQTRWGRDELKNIFGSGVPVNAWGYYDYQTLKFAKERFKALYDSGRPFMLTALTLDTHPPQGFPSPYCRAQGILQGDDSMLDAVRCTDHLAAEFVRFVQEQDHRDDTLVVVLTDHTSHRNTVFDILKKAERRDLVFWVFAPEQEGAIVHREGASTFDVAATILALAGGKLEGLGFGRNLLADAVPPAPPGALFHSHTAELMAKLWQPPVLGGELVVMPDQKILMVGGQRLRLPVMIRFNEDYRIEDVAWPGPEAPLISRLAPLSIMVNDCGWFDDQKAGRFCLYYRTQAGVLSAHPLASSTVFQRDTLTALLEDRTKSVPLRLEQRGYLISSGGTAHFSGALWQGKSTSFARGINLLRFGDAGVDILATVDTCARNLDDAAVETFGDIFRNTIETLYLVVQDSAVCGSDNLGKLFNVIEAPELARLGFREPYIAIFDEHKQVRQEIRLSAEERIFYPVDFGQEPRSSDKL
ncbi:MAG: sulfatase-like hydrolase/transferase [Porticoccaceae bacterium]